MNFKTKRQCDDFAKLGINNPKLLNIITLLDHYTILQLKKEITITDVFRTKEEFDSLYSATPAENRPKDSPHCHWNAVDIRSSDFTSEEIKDMLQFLNTFKNSNGKPVAIYHAISGNVNHFHVQSLG